MGARRIDANGLEGLWLVDEEGSDVVGYACATAWHTRASYRHSMETSIYLHPTAVGRGVGSALYSALLERVRLAGRHVAVGAIALPNPASVALHRRMGFRRVGILPEIGQKLGRWVDVEYWALLLEERRRSSR